MNALPKQIMKGVVLPLCPSANRYWRTRVLVSKQSRVPMAMTYVSAEAKVYINYIKELALINHWRFGTTKDIDLNVVVCPRDRRSIDCHNYTKVVCDALQQAGVIVDDKQIKVLTAVEGRIVKGGQLIINMWEITHEADKWQQEAMLGFTDAASHTSVQSSQDTDQQPLNL